MNTNPCLTCKFAVWDRAKNGRLHPNGVGNCSWTSGEFKIPKSVGYNKPRLPIKGAYISRGTEYKREIEPCDTWEKAE